MGIYKKALTFSGMITRWRCTNKTSAVCPALTHASQTALNKRYTRQTFQSRSVKFTALLMVLAGRGLSWNSWWQKLKLCPFLSCCLHSPAQGDSSPVITHHRLQQPVATLITLLSVICLSRKLHSFCLIHKRLLLKEVTLWKICNSQRITCNCLFLSLCVWVSVSQRGLSRFSYVS